MIALDLSRLLRRACSATPTGIDRVELAYALHVAAEPGPHCYAARNILGGVGLLPQQQAERFVARLATRWRTGATVSEAWRIVMLAWRLRLGAMWGELRLQRVLRASDQPPVYLLVSHQKLDRAAGIARLKARCAARFLCLIHDLIPLETPHLARPAQETRHRRRIETVAALADAVIVNSAATREALTGHLGPSRRRLPILVAPLAGNLPQGRLPANAEHPYFVCIGTIECRKNHHLLVAVWGRLARELGDRAPRLVVIGRKGFGGRRAADGFAALGGLVSCRSGVPDVAMAALLAGARALLFPTRAEGFGLPVVESLSQAVPVLCSDLPALRECGRGVAEYLDPDDADAWHRAILDYAVDTPRRHAQSQRLMRWKAPCWAAHFAIAERAIAGLLSLDAAELAGSPPALEASTSAGSEIGC
ncbi:MAG: glycosyltransferase [Alphaproteobacteria bacterium]|nr:glycosyltransferase [Alphaproteobacteria bacterium]